jgi:hypothetical protein
MDMPMRIDNPDAQRSSVALAGQQGLNDADELSHDRVPVGPKRSARVGPSPGREGCVHLELGQLTFLYPRCFRRKCRGVPSDLAAFGAAISMLAVKTRGSGQIRQDQPHPERAGLPVERRAVSEPDARLVVRKCGW